MSVLFRILAILIFVALLSNCKEDNRIEPEPSFRKIKQSIKIHDDNANGITLRMGKVTVRENAFFLYNSNGLLDSLYVLSDTTPNATLIKSIKVNYESNRIIGNAYLNRVGVFKFFFLFNQKKQITKILFGDVISNEGFSINYANDKISNINISPLEIPIYKNFVYDGSNNLLQFITSDSIGNLVKVSFTYSTKSIPKELDIKFASAGFQFLYAGGVNIISLMGLNTGISNTNRIFSRKETYLSTGQEIARYLFEYQEDVDNNIIGRKGTINDTIEINYDYKY